MFLAGFYVEKNSILGLKSALKEVVKSSVGLKEAQTIRPLLFFF
jgi:hypothetical protein